MSGLIMGILLFAQSYTPTAATPPNRKTGDWCRGIHMPNGTAEGINLLWTTLRGPEKSLGTIKMRMEALGAWTEKREGQPDGELLRVFYRDDLDARAIALLLNEIDAGKHGPVTTADYALPATTLPLSKCYRR